MSRATRRLSAILLPATAVALVLTGSASAAAFGPFADRRWGVSVFSDGSRLTIDLNNFQYCKNGQLAQGGESFTGFIDEATAPGTCRSVVAEFTPRQVGNAKVGCGSVDWREGNVLSDTTVPAGVQRPPVTYSGRSGTVVRTCIFGLRTDGRWHVVGFDGTVAVGPFALARPTIRVRSSNRGPRQVDVKCGPKANTLAPRTDAKVKATLRAGGTTIVRAASTRSYTLFTSNAITPGVTVTAKCEATTEISGPGARSSYPSVKTSRPFFVSPSATKRVPRR